MRFAWACMIVSLVGCAPPPEFQAVGGPTDPAVRIAFPPAIDPSGSGPFQLREEEPGAGWLLFVAIDVDNFEMVDPYDQENSEPVDGQGHWHLEVFGEETPVAGDAFTELEIIGEPHAVGDLVTVRAELKQNDHQPVLDESNNEVAATVEIQLAAAE